MKQKKGITIIITVLNIALIAVLVFFYIKTDRKAPAFSFQKSELIYREGIKQEALLEGITAWDDKDGDVTEKIVMEKTVKDEEENSITVFYAVSDSSGNIVKTSRVFPADFKTVLAAGERGLWADADFNASEKESMGNGLAGADRQDTEETVQEADNASENEDETSEAENAEGEADESEDASAKKLEEERKQIEEAAKQLAEEKKQLAEEKKALEEEKRRQAEEKQKADTAENRQPAENQNAAESKPKDRQQAEEKEENAKRDKGQKPVITLKAKEVNTTIGNPPAWVNLIQSLKDDRDDYETLFYSLSVSKYDLSRAGSYPVTLTVTDSDGNVSAPVSLTIHVN